MLQISLEKVCYIILKAREFETKEDIVEAEPGSNPSDEDERGVLADYPVDPVYEELESLIDSLNEDEQADLVALAWIGRDDYTAEEWDEVVAEAQERHTGSTASYLLGMPLLADFLEEGLSQLGLSCEDVELGRL